MDLHFVWERTEKGTLKVSHIQGVDQWADILTKALTLKSFLELQSPEQTCWISPTSLKGGVY